MKKEDINVDCLVKCCGVAPKYVDYSGFFCSVCNSKKFSWDGSPEFNAALWNTSFHKTNASGGYGTDQPFVLDYHSAPFIFDKGWKFAKLCMSFHLPWNEEIIRRHHFVLFQCPDREDDTLLKSADGYECTIDDYRHLHKIRLMSLDGKICEFDLPTFKNQCSAYAFLTRSWCTDGTWNYLLNIKTLNHKWRDKMEKALAPIGIPFANW
jgi:hypothetical protein